MPAAGPASAPESLDPADMRDIPDFGVDWPDLAKPDAVPEVAPSPPAAATDAGQPGAAVAGSAPAAAPAAPPATATDASAQQRYRIALEGVSGLDVREELLRERFNALSTLYAGRNDSANVAQIDRRAREDGDVLRELLRSFGYYDATVAARVEPGAAGAPATVTLAAEPGPIYRFGMVDITGLPADGPAAAALREAFPIRHGDPVDADRVTNAEIALRTQLGRSGYAFATVPAPRITIDHETREATLALDVATGTPRRFGQIELRGTRPLFDVDHLQRIARFAPGDAYDSARIDDFRRALIATGLVSSVRLTTEQGTQPDTVDVGVALERAPPRTIAGELGYGTGEGVRAEVSWQNRNLLPPEGAVTFRAVAGTQEQLLGAALRRSNFPRRDQVLTAQVLASHTNRQAYDAKTFTLAAGIERLTNIIWQKKWTWSAGGELVASDERDVIASTGQPRRRTFFIAAVPSTLAYDGSDDLLNPTKGYRLAGRVSPEISFQGSAFGYARAQADASAYLPVTGKTVLAGRVRLGTIFGASRDRIAPSRRFYSGGGGSVRGYGYQDIGPRDVNNDPIGGRSLAEFSIEARVRFGNFGVVPFLDGGNLYTRTYPDFSGMRYGTGLGVRYYTSFGPIRLDLGTPINRRPGDGRVAVYVSLGQAF